VNEAQKAELGVSKSLDVVLRGAHPSKTTKGEAAIVMGEQSWASPPNPASPRSGFNYGADLDTIVRGAHPSKTTKGEAAIVMGEQGGASLLHIGKYHAQSGCAEMKALGVDRVKAHFSKSTSSGAAPVILMRNVGLKGWRRG
jgi:hypothetical protein